MRKILIFSLSYYPRVSGAEVAIKEITDRISENEIEFHMITLRQNWSETEKIGNVRVHRVGPNLPFVVSKFLYPWLAFFKALKLQKIHSYEATWAMMASYAGWAAFLFKKMYPKIPFILSIQEGENFERREGIYRFLYRKIFKAANFIQVISSFLEGWSKHMGATCPIVIVPNAVDVNFFTKKKPVIELENLKNFLGKKAGDTLLVTTSRLEKKNAIEDIISSLTYLPKEVKFIVLGVGSLEGVLKKKVKDLGLEDRVQFLGFIPHADMPQYLHVSDIFVRPALSEGFGSSYIEAMAANIPVIATSVGGIPDFLREGETGLFCDVQNPKSIAEKVEKLIKDKESREYIVKNASGMVREKYDWNLIASNMKNEVFLKVL